MSPRYALCDWPILLALLVLSGNSKPVAGRQKPLSGNRYQASRTQQPAVTIEL